MPSHAPARPEPDRTVVIVTACALPVLIAALALILCGPHPTVRKARIAAASSATAALLVAPVAAALCTSVSTATSPEAGQATRNAHAQPLVALVAGVHRLHEIALSRFGGLYGP